MMARKHGKKADAADLPRRPEDETGHGIIRDRPDLESADEPPYTTTAKMTSPKFGSAGSGGAELEPGPK